MPWRAARTRRTAISLDPFRPDRPCRRRADDRAFAAVPFRVADAQPAAPAATPARRRRAACARRRPEGLPERRRLPGRELLRRARRLRGDPDPHQRPLPLLSRGLLPGGPGALLVEEGPVGLQGRRTDLLALLVAEVPHRARSRRSSGATRTTRPTIARPSSSPACRSRGARSPTPARSASGRSSTGRRSSAGRRRCSGRSRSTTPTTRARSARWRFSTGGSARRRATATSSFPLLFSTRSPESAFTYADPADVLLAREGRQAPAGPAAALRQPDQEGRVALLAHRLSHARRRRERRIAALALLVRIQRRQPERLQHLLPGGVELSFRQRQHHRRRPAGPRAAQDLVLQHACIPLWWSGGDTAKGEAFRTLLPFFYWERADHDKRSLWVTPIGGYSRDDVQGSRTLAAVAVDLHAARSHQRAAHHHAGVHPLPQRRSGLDHESDRAAASTGARIRPARRRRSSRSSGGSATPRPARPRRRCCRSSRYRSGPAESSWFAGVFPLWAYHRTFTGQGGGEPGWSAGLFPLAFFGSARRQRPRRGLPAVLALRERRTRRRPSLFPLFYRHRDKHETSTGMLPLVFFGHNDRGTQLRRPVPVLLALRRRPRGLVDHGDAARLPPLDARQLERRAAAAGLRGRRRRQVARRDRAAVLAVHRRRRAEVDDGGAQLLPPQPRQRDHRLLLPADLLPARRAARRQRRDQLHAVPDRALSARRRLQPGGDAAGRVVEEADEGGDRAFGFVGPYLWYRGAIFDAKGVPFIYADVTNHATDERTRQYGPWFEIDAPGSRSRIFFPFYGRYDDAQEHDTYVFPTFFRQRKTNGDGDRHRSSRSTGIRARAPASTTMAGLWYSHRDTGVHDTGVAPFYFYAKNDKRSILAVPPVLLYRRHDFTNDSVRMLGGDHRLSHAAIPPRTRRWCSRSGGRDTTSRSAAPRAVPGLLALRGRARRTPRSTSWGRSSGRRAARSRTRGLAPIAWRSDDSATGASSNALHAVLLREQRAEALPLLHAARRLRPERDVAHLVRAAVRGQRRGRAALPHVRAVLVRPRQQGDRDQDAGDSAAALRLAHDAADRR